MNEPIGSCWRGVVALARTVVKPFLSLFSFTNTQLKLKKERDFDLRVSANVEQVNKFLTDLVGMKERESKNTMVLQYVDTRCSHVQSYIKTPVTTTDHSLRPIKAG